MSFDPQLDLPADELKSLAEGFLRKWRQRCHVADWDLRIAIETVDENYGAESRYQWRERRGVIVLPPDVISRHRSREFFSACMSAQDIVEESVVHELQHVGEVPLSEIVMDELTRQFGDTGVAHGMLLAAVRDWREWWICHTTRMLIEAERSGGWRT